VTEARKVESLRHAYSTALLELGDRRSDVVVVDADGSASTGPRSFGGRFPDRFFSVGATERTMMTTAAGLATRGRTVFASSSAAYAAGQAYHTVRESICLHRANVKIVATDGGPRSGEAGGTSPMVEDIGIMRGLPGMTVVVPADAPTTRTATFAVADREGPAYVRLPRESLPTISDGSFKIGAARELRAGNDLAVVAVGALVARGLEVAEELARVGVSARVLDFASVKPFDEPALLRAARDTGAILVLEEHSVLTGVGAMVAATTSENYPVPVRRVGVPDVFVESGDPSTLLDRIGLSSERIRDEAWELLRMRGKVQ
jgi:transketolase